MNTLRRRPALLVSAGICTLLILIAVIAPWLAPYDPLTGDLLDRLMPPVWQEGGSIQYLLGTDVLGRDILSRLLYGTRISLSVCLISIAIAAIIGSTLGIVAGYLGGWVESLIMRLVDIAVSIPAILLALLFGVLFGPSFSNIIIIIGFLLWSQFARMARGETLKVKKSDYIDLARTAGCSSAYIMFKHVLPNVAASLVILATLQVGTVIIIESSLSFLGVGVPPPTPAWGSMIAEGRSYVISAWWIAMFPGLAIMFTVIAANVLGDELTDLINPALANEVGV
jgi:peptide/nickel transport system permease protein